MTTMTIKQQIDEMLLEPGAFDEIIEALEQFASSCMSGVNSKFVDANHTSYWWFNTTMRLRIIGQARLS